MLEPHEMAVLNPASFSEPGIKFSVTFVCQRFLFLSLSDGKDLHMNAAE